MNQRLDDEAKAVGDVRAGAIRLEKIMAELVNAGIPKEDIGVHFNSNHRTVYHGARRARA